MTEERLTINGDTVNIYSRIKGKIAIPVSKIPKMYNEREGHLQINNLKVVLTEQEATQLKQFL